MKPAHLLSVLLAFPGTAAAAPGDSKPDEAYLRQVFELSLEQAKATLQVREAKRQEFLEQSRIGGGRDTCLAYAVETGDCSISAAEFDRGLVSYLPDSLELQTAEGLARKARAARQSVLEQLVDRAFLEAYRPEGDPPRPDPRNRDPGTVGRAFPADYDVPTWLRAFPRIRAQVVAASDSAWLASRFGNPRSDILPATLPAWRLPDSVAALLARFPRGAWTPIIRVPFGFLACSWLDSLPAPGKLAKIRPRLAHSGADPGAAARAQALKARDGRQAGCRDEDTLGVSLRLSPPLRHGSQDPGPAWSAAPSTALPASVHRSLGTGFRQGARDTLGPFLGEYGVWTIAASSPGIRPGRILDSAACLARIAAELRRDGDAERIRSEWEALTSKPDDGTTADVRTALLERLSRQGIRPEAAYRRLREDWASRSLRFTRDPGFPEPSPESSPEP